MSQKQGTETQKTKKKSSPKLLLAYSLGEVASSISWFMINNYLMLFYTDIVTLSSGVISVIMFIVRLWSAVFDPIMGGIADRTRTKWGRFRPYLYIMPPFLAIFNILTFTVFPVEGIAKAVLCFVCYILCCMAYSAINIPYQALQNVIAIDSQVRMDLATARGIGSSIISIILSAVGMPMILFFSKGDSADANGFFVTTLIFSLIMIPMFWICAKGCKETYTEVLHKNDTGKKPSFKDSIKSVAKNSELMKVVLCTVLGAICVSGRMGLISYFVIYVIGNIKMVSPVLTAMTVGQLIGTFIVPFGTRKFTKKGYLIILQMIMNISFLVLFFNPHCGTVLLLILSFISGLGNSSSSIAYGLVGDSIEYGAWKIGERQEGVAASMLSLAAKFATAVCGSVGVLLLGFVGYQAGAVQSASTQQGINIIVNLLPAIIGFLSLIPVFMYKLSPKKVEEISKDLAEGRHAWDHEDQK
jgi:sugar (glycoside-pentoside-hexuronide) transporter